MPLDEPPGVRRVSERIARTRRVAAAEAYRDRLADQHRAALTERTHGCCICHGLIRAEQFAAELRRHVEGLDQILDADRHPIDRAQRSARSVSGVTFVGGFASAFEIEERKRHDRRLERVDALDAALEISAWSVRSIRKARPRVMKAQHPVLCGIVVAGRRLGVCERHQEMWL